MPSDPRYDLYGWDYPLVNPPDERALAWYRRHAREMGGPVLDLACGTGPLLAALAADGHEVVGLDLSETMLGVARARIARLPAEDRARTHVVHGDMSSFDLEPRFALAIVADNSLREVSTVEAMLACLRCVRRHLLPGGRLLVVERRFDPARYPGGVAEWPWSEPLVHPETGLQTRRRIRVRLDLERRRLHGLMTYRTIASDGSETDEDLPFESPVLEPDEYVALFDEAGFEVRLFVGYGDSADDGSDPMLCFVAHANPAP